MNLTLFYAKQVGDRFLRSIDTLNTGPHVYQEPGFFSALICACVLSPLRWPSQAATANCSDVGSLVFHSCSLYMDGKQITAERRDDVPRAALCSEGTLRFDCALIAVPSTLLLHERKVWRENSNENSSSRKKRITFMLAEQLVSFSILCLTRDFIRQGHAREKRKEYRATRTRSQAIDRG